MDPTAPTRYTLGAIRHCSLISIPSGISLSLLATRLDTGRSLLSPVTHTRELLSHLYNLAGTDVFNLKAFCHQDLV